MVRGRADADMCFEDSRLASVARVTYRVGLASSTLTRSTRNSHFLNHSCMYYTSHGLDDVVVSDERISFLESLL